ncbi:MAG: ATP-binding protein [Kiritimatiellae bacterium]|nr:ATP-binding protein [Kiritimatiellia bacterium]
MAFLSGPRQSGKTTLVKSLATDYLNWDDSDVRLAVAAGQSETVRRFALDRLSSGKPVVVFDELHKYPRWKGFLKGFFDVYGEGMKILATGSAKMDIYKRGGDSMMGRYFPYRMHPLSVAELLDVSLPGENLIRPPRPLDDEEWNSLVEFGGFPEPFTRRNRRFSLRWRDLRMDQMMLDDIRTLTQVQELEQIRILAEILARRSGDQLVYDSLARDVSIDPKTAKKWVGVLKYLYYGFEVRPWFRNVENGIRKTPKWYLRDWSGIDDNGKRYETIAACHLLKAVEAWTDLGYGRFELFYLRDKQKREVDFLVSLDGQPWFLAEVKSSDTHLSQMLGFYQRVTGARHAFQLVFDEPFVSADCFTRNDPVVVPARTFLSQLV